MKPLRPANVQPREASRLPFETLELTFVRETGEEEKCNEAIINQETINQSVNPINQSINPINQSINPFINDLIFGQEAKLQE